MTDPAYNSEFPRKKITLQNKVVHLMKPVNIGFTCLLFFAAFFRFTGIGSESFWMDEGYTMAYTEPPFFKMLSFIATRDVHPPLYYVFIKFWQQFSTNEVFLRFPSAVFGILAVWAVWSLIKENWGTLAGFASGFMIAISEGAIWYSQEVRMYSLLLLFTALSMKYLLRYIDGSMTRRDWILSILSTTALLYTHNVAALMWVSQGVFCLLLGGIRWVKERRSEGEDISIGLKDFRRWFLSQIVITLLYLPWLFVVVNQRLNMDHRFWLSAPNYDSVRSVFTMALAYKSWGPLSGLAVSAGVLAALLRGAANLRSPKIAGTLVCFVLPLIMSYLYSIKGTPMLVDRTLFFTAIPLYMLLGAIIPDIAEFVQGGLVRKSFTALRALAGLILLVILAVVNVNSWSVEVKTQTKEDFRSAAERCSGLVNGNAAIVFNNAASQAAFDYYFHRYKRSENVKEIGLPVHYSLVPKGEANLEPLVTLESINVLDMKLQGTDIAALVLTHQWYSDPNQLALRYFSQGWRYLENRAVGGIEILLFMR